MIGLLSGVGLLAAAGDARAAGACAADIEKFCKDIPTGPGRELLCLQEHASELSSACQESLEKRKTRTRQARERERNNPNRAWASACTEDIRTLCSDIPGGYGTAVQCLTEHASSLSPNCKTALSSRPKSR
jgi:hypothetical protein